MTKVNSILNYIKGYQDSIEGLRHNVPGFTFNGFTFTVDTETRSGAEVQVITVFGIVNTELDEGAMDAIVQTVPKLYQSISSVTVTDYGQIIKEPNAPIYYNQTIEIVTTNEQVDQLEVWGKDRGNDSGNFLISDDIPEMPVPYSYKSYFYRVKSVYPDWSKDSADEQLEGNNEVSGDEVAHDSGHDLTEQEAKEILDNMLGKNEEFNALTEVLDKLFKAGTFPEEKPETPKELIDKFQDENGTTEDSEGKQNVILKLPEENITLNDGIDEYHYDIHFVSTMTDGPEKVTSIDIGGATTNNSKFFQKGHKVILSIRLENLTVDITTAVIDEVTEDNDGVRLFVTEQLPTPSPVKDEREGAELKHEGINSDHTEEPNPHRPWEQAIREDIMSRDEDPDDYVIQRSRNTPKCPKGEPGVEGMKTPPIEENGVSTGSNGTIQGKTIELGNTSITTGDKTMRITADKITLEGVTIVQEPHNDGESSVTDISGVHTLGELFKGLDGK